MVESAYSKVKVNNEIDFCSVTDTDVKKELEKAFLKARVSYFLRWERPGLFARLFTSARTNIVFCINAAQKETAQEAVETLGNRQEDIQLLGTKSNNKSGF